MGADFERAKDFALGRLANELAPWLTYHSLRHTRDDVLPAALRLAQAAQVDDSDLLCLATAAVFHDLGFIIAYDDHEAHGIFLARGALPEFGYSVAQVDTVAALIAATKMPQSPASPLAELLCDADLDVLGREDFWAINRQLLAETEHYQGRAISEAEWLNGQANFLAEHRFFSPIARRLRDPGKLRNLALTRHVLAGLNGASEH